VEIYWTRTKTIVTASLLVLVALALIIKRIWFPSVEPFFSLDYEHLREAPANILVLRPTKFAESRRPGTLVRHMPTTSGHYDPRQIRLVGRNVSFAEVIAIAYQCQQSRVLLPANAPTNGFDFLVTKPKPEEVLQQALKRKLGYTAGWKERDVEVFELKVRVPNAAGLRPSAAGAFGRSEYKNGKLHFRHAQVQLLTGMLQGSFKKPVMDKTGLKGFYDFSIPWERSGRRYGPDAAALNEYLGELGLALVPATEWMPMMVVEKK
jgi:uncharacterized protein (TIGR03435 family)